MDRVRSVVPIASTRRRVLAAVCGASTLALAGCLDADGDSRTAEPDSTAPPESDATETDTAATGDADLDLREANVTAVAVDCSPDRECRFDVTLYHDDEGEDGYANWWQVETRGGDRLGRRDLRHAHGTREFTRSETVAVPEDVAEVVVRGHDQTHGYGGQAMTVNVETARATAVRQGSEPDSFAE